MRRSVRHVACTAGPRRGLGAQPPPEPPSSFQKKTPVPAQGHGCAVGAGPGAGEHSPSSCGCLECVSLFSDPYYGRLGAQLRAEDAHIECQRQLGGRARRSWLQQRQPNRSGGIPGLGVRLGPSVSTLHRHHIYDLRQHHVMLNLHQRTTIGRSIRLSYYCSRAQYMGGRSHWE